MLNILNSAYMTAAVMKKQEVVREVKMIVLAQMTCPTEKIIDYNLNINSYKLTDIIF